MRDDYDRRSHRDLVIAGPISAYCDLQCPGRLYPTDRDGIEDHRDTYDNPPVDIRHTAIRIVERDSDHDGTPDRCDRTPYGERANGIDRDRYRPQHPYDRDSNHDGIPDRRDRTPYGPPDTSPPAPGQPARNEQGPDDTPPRKTGDSGSKDNWPDKDKTSNSRSHWKDSNKGAAARRRGQQEVWRRITRGRINDPKGGG